MNKNNDFGQRKSKLKQKMNRSSLYIFATAVIALAFVFFISESNAKTHLNSGSADVANLKAERDHALIVFTFDDGNESDYALAYPILQKYGIQGTSFINPFFPDHDAQNKLSWKEIKQMYESGWDFQDHTYAHISVGDSTADQVRRSMEMVNHAFKRNGLKTPDIIAYPYGSFNQGGTDIIKQYRKQARLADEDGFVELKNINPYEIKSINADIQTKRFLNNRKKLVDQACAKNTVIVFRVHCLYRNKLNDMGKQAVQTSSSLFAQLVAYCVKKGCEFTTMDGLLKLYAIS